MTKAAFLARRIGGVDCLVPWDDEGRDLVRRLAAKAPDKGCTLSYHVPRNLRHLALYYVLLQRMIDGGAWKGDKDSLDDFVRIGCGHVKTVIRNDGQVFYVAKHIDTESMDQIHFSRFFDRATWFLCDRLLGDGEAWQALRDEIIESVDGDLGRRAKEADRRQAA